MKRLYLLIIFTVSVFFTSCIFNFSISKNGAEKFIKNYFDEEIEILGKTEVPENYKSYLQTDSEYEFWECYSPILEQNFYVVQVKQHSHIKSETYYETNYFSLLQEKSFAKNCEDIVKKDFSNAKCFYKTTIYYDKIEDTYKNSDYNYALSYTNGSNYFIILDVQESELTDFETRLHSAAYALYSNNFTENKTIYVIFPDSSAIDFSQLSYDSLSEDEELISKFAKRYRGFLTLEEF